MDQLFFPAFKYGAYDEVRRAAGRAVTQVLRADSLRPILDGSQVDVATVEGLIVLDRRWSSISATQPNVHGDVFWNMLENRLENKPNGRTRFKSLVESGLSQPWGFVGVVDSQRYFLMKRASEQLRFLIHTRAHWRGSLGAATPAAYSGSKPARRWTVKTAPIDGMLRADDALVAEYARPRTLVPVVGSSPY
jgi:hypothetical protein